MTWRRDAEIVLREKAERFDAIRCARARRTEGSSRDVAGEEIGEAVEIDAAAAFGGAQIIDAAVAEDAAEAERVLAVNPGNGVGIIFGVAGIGPERPA